jgi:hypothetical protein
VEAGQNHFDHHSENTVFGVFIWEVSRDDWNRNAALKSK